MKSKEYWRKRFEQLENAAHNYSIEAYQKIEPVFTEALKDIEYEITKWYNRFSFNNMVSIADAKRMLNAAELKELRWDVKEYIKHGKENYNDIWTKELENASARFHINRLEALKIRTQQAMELAFGNELDVIDDMVRKVYSESYYHSIFELQKGVGIGTSVGHIDNRKLERIISKPWAPDGKNFSERIWNSKSRLINEVHSELTRNCILGKGPDEAIKNISHKFQVSKAQAGRLVQTEQAFFHATAQKDAFNELDVEQFEIVATLDSHTSAICREMDGKHFTMDEYEPGVTAPPFHPWCRSVTAPYFDDEWGRDGERAARGEDGKTYYVPADMTYEEWGKKFANDAVNVYRNASSDKEQYNRYKNVLKELAPKTIDEFRKIKYDDTERWEKLKYQYRTVNRYEIDGDVPIETVLKLDNVAWYMKQKGFSIEGITEKQNRKDVKKLPKEGNAGSMLLDGKIYFSHSRFGLEGTVALLAYKGKYPAVGLQNKRQFKVLHLGDGIPREYDTEAKFLEFVALQKKTNDVFTVTILSEKHICESCQNVVRQFKEKFPYATVNIISGKRGYNNSPDGLRTWRYRRKVKRQ